MILRIKEIMKEKGIGREELANGVDVSLATISNINNEKNYPSFRLLIKIAKYLDVDVRELLVATKPGNVDDAKKHLEEALKLLK
mgnify:CR=1 FL=1